MYSDNSVNDKISCPMKRTFTNRNIPRYIMVSTHRDMDQSFSVGLHNKHHNGDWYADNTISWN